MRAKKIDANQKEIVKELRKSGFSVFVSSSMGNGFPDLAISRKGQTWLIEIKDGDKYLSAQKLTPKEQQFFDNWQGDVRIISSLEDVQKFVLQCL